MEPPSNNRVVVINQSGKRLRLQPIRRAVDAVLARHGCKSGLVNVLLTRDEEIQALNKKFRSVDEPTDVLSFPAGEFPGAPLGDIAISVPYAERQATARRVSLSQEIGYLAIHGALHLMGYDDNTEEERAGMVLEMNEAAVQAGLKPDVDWCSLLHAESSGP